MTKQEAHEQLAVYRKALEWIEENADEDEEINLNEILRSIAEEDEENFRRREEESLRNAWQQDIIDMYRFER